MTRIYVYVKPGPTVITDTMSATVIFDEHASLPDPTPTQDAKLADARKALAELVRAARTYNEWLDGGEWTQGTRTRSRKALLTAESWLVSDAHAAAVRNSKKERQNG